MAKRCLTRKRVLASARASARRTGDKIDIWQCGRRCFKAGAAAGARCRWVGWVLPRVRR
jgi:hypothetical protein